MYLLGRVDGVLIGILGSFAAFALVPALFRAGHAISSLF
jgi:hypothetical protein